MTLYGYKIIPKVRQNGTNAPGGVLITEKITYNFISIDHENDYKVAFTNLIINGITLKIVIAYRPPSQTPIENQIFVPLLHDKLSTSNEFILVGDFNHPSFIMTIISISRHIFLAMTVRCNL